LSVEPRAALGPRFRDIHSFTGFNTLRLAVGRQIRIARSVGPAADHLRVSAPEPCVPCPRAKRIREIFDCTPCHKGLKNAQRLTARVR